MVVVGEMCSVLTSFPKYTAVFAEIFLSCSSLEFPFIDKGLRREESRVCPQDLFSPLGIVVVGAHRAEGLLQSWGGDWGVGFGGEEGE